jgi:hypothetical protein
MAGPAPVVYCRILHSVISNSQRELIMMKSDHRNKNIVTAAIRRKGMEIETWTGTRLWDDGDRQVVDLLSNSCSFAENELPILYSFIDLKTWTVFTTQAVWYMNEGRSGVVRITNIAQYDFGAFKGLRGEATETLQIVDSEGDIHRCQYETGKPSMGSVYALMTLCVITRAA